MNTNKIANELSKCSKKVLIQIIMDRCIGHPFNNLTIEQIKTYKKNEQLEKLDNKIKELDAQFDNCKCNTFEEIIKRNKLLDC